MLFKKNEEINWIGFSVVKNLDISLNPERRKLVFSMVNLSDSDHFCSERGLHTFSIVANQNKEGDRSWQTCSFSYLIRLYWMPIQGSLLVSVDQDKPWSLFWRSRDFRGKNESPQIGSYSCQTRRIGSCSEVQWKRRFWHGGWGILD